MIPGLSLIEKIITTAIELFVSNKRKRDILRENFLNFFRKSDDMSKESSRLNKEYKKIRKKRSKNERNTTT